MSWYCCIARLACFSIALVLFPVGLRAQEFVGSFNSLIHHNVPDLHLVRHAEHLYGVYTDERQSPSGQRITCRLLEVIRFVNLNRSPLPIVCARRGQHAGDVFFDVEAVNNQGSWELVGGAHTCDNGPNGPESYDQQFSYTGLNGVYEAMSDTSGMDLERFLALEICQ